MAQQFPFGEGPFGEGGFGGDDAVEVLADCGFGLGPFGLGPFGIGCLERWHATGVKVVAGYDGPQIVVTWAGPQERVDFLRIMRRQGAWPESESDPQAEKVYEEAGLAQSVGKFADVPENLAKLGTALTPGWWHYRIFTSAEGFLGMYESGGGSEGFDLAYDPDAFDDFMWDDLVPDSWGLVDTGTSQVRPVLHSVPATSERITLSERPDKEGFGRRFVRILALMLRRVLAHAEEVSFSWDLPEVRADALDRIAASLGVEAEPSATIPARRRDLMDARDRLLAKGTISVLDIAVRQEARLLDTADVSLIEMHNRVHYAWDPSNPDHVDPGLVIGQADMDGQVGDVSTYGWTPFVDTAYNERGLRIHLVRALDPDVRERVRGQIRRLKAGTVTVEVWEAGQMTFRET